MSCFVQPPTVAFTITHAEMGSNAERPQLWPARLFETELEFLFFLKKIIIIHSQNIQNRAHYGRMICRTFKITVKHLKSQNTFASI